MSKDIKVLVSNVFLPKYNRQFKPDQWYEGELIIVNPNKSGEFKYRVKVDGVIRDWKNMKFLTEE